MIRTKDDLRLYLECDRIALGYERKKPSFARDRIWRFQIHLRKCEYYYSQKKNFCNIIPFVWHFMCYILWCKLHLCEIPLNVIGPGLSIWHGKSIIINSKAKIGSNFSISAGCVVGQAHSLCPKIGDNVEMTIHSMVLGGIRIANNVTIGAGAIVLKDVIDGG